MLATLTDAMEESQIASKERASSTVSQSSADAADGGKSVAKSDSYVPLLSQRGRCALHALTYMLPLLRKLVQRDLYLKSPVTTSMTDLSDDLGPFQMHELLYRTFSSIGKSLLPAFRGRLLRFLPSEVQQEWIGIMRDLICSLQTPLPPATPFIHSPPAGGPINISLNQVRQRRNVCLWYCYNRPILPLKMMVNISSTSFATFTLCCYLSAYLSHHVITLSPLCTQLTAFQIFFPSLLIFRVVTRTSPPPWMQLLPPLPLPPLLPPLLQHIHRSKGTTPDRVPQRSTWGQPLGKDKDKQSQLRGAGADMRSLQVSFDYALHVTAQ